MDIKNIANQVINSYLPQNERLGEVDALSTARNRGRGSERTGDSLKLSHEAGLLNAARSTAMQEQDLRQDKIEALKAQIEDGSYQVDSQKIAAGLLREEADLFS